MGADKGELPPVLDLEPVLDANKKDISPSGNALLTRAKTWLNAVESAFGRKPMIYTSTLYVTSHAVNAAWLANYPLWIAQYPWMPGTRNEYTDPANPPTPGGIPQQPPVFQPWIIWQYTKAGNLNAFSGGMDFDYFNGSLADLAQFNHCHADGRPHQHNQRALPPVGLSIRHGTSASPRPAHGRGAGR